MFDVYGKLGVKLQFLVLVRDIPGIFRFSVFYSSRTYLLIRRFKNLLFSIGGLYTVLGSWINFILLYVFVVSWNSNYLNERFWSIFIFLIILNYHFQLFNYLFLIFITELFQFPETSDLVSILDLNSFSPV